MSEPGFTGIFPCYQQTDAANAACYITNGYIFFKSVRQLYKLPTQKTSLNGAPAETPT